MKTCEHEFGIRLVVASHHVHLLVLRRYEFTKHFRVNRLKKNLLCISGSLSPPASYETVDRRRMCIKRNTMRKPPIWLVSFNIKASMTTTRRSSTIARSQPKPSASRRSEVIPSAAYLVKKFVEPQLSLKVRSRLLAPMLSNWTRRREQNDATNFICSFSNWLPHDLLDYMKYRLSSGRLDTEPVLFFSVCLIIFT